MTPIALKDDFGFRLRLSYYLEDGLKKQVDSVIAVKNEKLYVVMYVSPSIHYGDKYSDEIDSMFSSIVIS